MGAASVLLVGQTQPFDQSAEMRRRAAYVSGALLAAWVLVTFLRKVAAIFCQTASDLCAGRGQQGLGSSTRSARQVIAQARSCL